MLLGRHAEQAVVDRLLAQARAGRSGALVLAGEAGIGKSALLDHAAGAEADDVQILRGAGIETEAALPFAGLHLILRPVTDRIAGLPVPQAQALGRAFGLESGPAGDRFLVGLAVLTLLSDLAEVRPLLCLIDDAQWLDHASAEALLFAARRLKAEGVALIFAVRDDEPAFPAPGVPRLALTGLDTTAATDLLARHAAELTPDARDRILHQARGNPLALQELPAALDHAHLPHPASRIQQTFRDRIAALPARARDVLLLAAAEDTGDLDVVLDAAGRLGLSAADLDPAETARLIEVGGSRLAFRHPLVRAAAYRSAPLSERVRAHGALAAILEARCDPLRAAWHLATAATAPDEVVAAALERGAEQAQVRGGHAAVAIAYERAAQLSPDPRARGRRLVRAALAAVDAGRHEPAVQLADQATAHPLDPLERARIAQVRASVAAGRGQPEAAHTTLIEAVRAIADRDPDTAAVMCFEALITAWLAADFAAAANTAALMSELRLPQEAPVRPLVRAAASMATFATEALPRALTSLSGLIKGLREHTQPLSLRAQARIGIWDLMIGDDQEAYHRALSLERDCRTQGAIGVLPLALMLLGRSQMFLGLCADAWASAEEGLRIAADTAQPYYALLLNGLMAYLAAIGGDEDRCRAHAQEIGTARDVGASALRGVALSLLDLGHGRYEDALARHETLDTGPAARTMMTLHSWSSLVEAAVRAGRPETAHALLARSRQWAEHTGQPWARAVVLRCQALLAPDDEAGRLFAQAVALHGQGGRPFERARTELLYGTWLRRARRRAEARPHLLLASDIFQRLGARPWLDRTLTELRANGDRRPTAARQTGAIGRLTPQERQVVRMAATGMSNRDIAAQLVLSPRTVGYHLSNAYPKLGVAGRGELAGLDLIDSA